MFPFSLLVIAIVVIFAVTKIRKTLISQPLLSLFKRLLPPLSETERQAMEAGNIWWEAELFRGKPDWNTLLSYPSPRLSAREQAFLDNQVNTLLAMLDDFNIVQHRHDLPPEVWQYLKHERFFSLIIPEEYGGLDFSAFANSTIVARIATRSLSAAVTMMVPNSLGPGELLTHYGTAEQKHRWLPALAEGREIPCFALTGPEAGSDASAIPDSGIVCYGDHEGEQVLGIRLNWDKRYITLAPVATVLGLAFKLHDPQGLLGEREELGITCALIPTDHPGVEIGRRHLPMGLAFMNGPTCGTDVFIPLDWIIGGPDYAGQGWRMLVECLSAGRGISLPALATACGHMSARSSSAYAYVRRQFGQSIGQFEGVQDVLARIGALTYQLEACRSMTAGALDLRHKPGIVTAIAKYHMTEMARTIVNDAMDLHAGRAIQMGPLNYLAHAYLALPVAITVEGANILTRSMIIFGQGASRCHPYLTQEMEAAAEADPEQALDRFDRVLTGHMAFAAGNLLQCLWQGFTVGVFNRSPVSGETAPYYKQLTRMSRALALMSDIAMATLGGGLKRREMLSARLGDVLSHLYLASTTLKYYEDNGRRTGDLPYVHYAVKHNLHQIGIAFEGFLENFAPSWLAWPLKRLVFPLGNGYHPPQDACKRQICEAMMTPGEARDRLTHLCLIGNPSGMDPIAVVDQAFAAMFAVRGLQKKLDEAQREKLLPRKLSLEDLLSMAQQQGILSAVEADELREAMQLRQAAISVDSFVPQELGDMPQAR